MKKEAIILKWNKNGKEFSKQIDREKFFNLMCSVKSAFEHDNQVSKFFCEIIPEVEWIKIYKDRNEQIDIPFIEYEVPGQDHHFLEILRHHRIVWSILEGYMKNDS